MIPERRILVYVAAMITGIILVMRYDAVRKLPQLIQSHKVEYQNVQSPNLLSHYVAELSVTTIAAAAIVLHGIARYAPISLLTACLRRKAVLRRPC